MSKHDKVPSVSKAENRPLLPLGRLQREIDNLFHSFNSDFKMPDLFSEWTESQFMPSMDVRETDKKIEISAELPGVDEKNIDVEIQDGTLVISGKKDSKSEQNDGDYYRSERSYGSFYRTISLPSGIDEKSIDAKFDNGVLSLTVKKPKNTERKSKKVPVKKV